MFSINESVTGYVDELLNREEELNVKSHYLENQSTVIDCGVGVGGSIGAGVLCAMVSLGGLGRVSIGPGIIDGYYLQFAQVWVDRPSIACLGSQKPSWRIKTDSFTGMAFGPARAIAQKPKAIYAAIDYVDDAETAVINIEASTLPSAREIELIAKQCSTNPECVVALVARPNSIAGSIVNSTRTVEWAMNRLFQLQYDTRDITSASSAAPVAPIRAEEQDFMGASMDCIAYYGMVSLYAKAASDVFRSATADFSKSYGRSFQSLLKDAQGDFSRVDPAIFAPARLMVNGHDGTLQAYGKLNPDMLLKSFGLKS